MANVLNQEPQAFGLIKFITNFGQLDIELFTKQCPKATENFVQLCLDGYYEDTIFDRVEKDFIAVGGGKPDQEDDEDEQFPDEFHSRLRFTRRGLLATANTKKNANGSRFFFTLGATPELQNKHTIFGRVKGDSVYTLVDLNECQTDDDNCPLSEKKITAVNVIENPYPELNPRRYKHYSVGESNGSDEEEDYQDPLAGPSTEFTCTKKKLVYNSEDEEGQDDDTSDEDNVKREQNLQQKEQEGISNEEAPESNKVTNVNEPEPKQSRSAEIDEDQRKRKLCEIDAEFERLKKQLETGSEIRTLSDRRQNRSGSDIDNQYDRSNGSGDISNIKLISKKDRKREREAMDKIENFKKKLQQASKSEPFPTKPDKKIEEFNELDDLDLVDGNAWMTHKFIAKDDEDVSRAKNATTKDDTWYELDGHKHSRHRHHRSHDRKHSDEPHHGNHHHERRHRSRSNR